MISTTQRHFNAFACIHDLQAREELAALVASDELRNARVLVFANKSDMPNALDPAELTDKLGLRKLAQPWYAEYSTSNVPDAVQVCAAHVRGDGRGSVRGARVALQRAQEACDAAAVLTHATAMQHSGYRVLMMSSIFISERTVSAASVMALVDTSSGCTTFSSRMLVIVPCACCQPLPEAVPLANLADVDASRLLAGLVARAQLRHRRDGAQAGILRQRERDHLRALVLSYVG